MIFHTCSRTADIHPFLQVPKVKYFLRYWSDFGLTLQIMEILIST
ncbi:hypothetical protein Ocin01_06154 [Orchesella cincta]|uniref:Uncharacterized protein n=1 Tax=Orchesella cincta TaxID=48709 RepID=A0A1D2N5I7_ORCCI|nr:hypothetical protein Ocin01_06154 [Orchesella cincta]